MGTQEAFFAHLVLDVGHNGVQPIPCSARERRTCLQLHWLKKKEKMRGEGNGEKDFIIYCTVRDVEKGFCLAEVSMTNSGRVCRVIARPLPSSPFMEIQWKRLLRAVPPTAEAAADQGKQKKSRRGCRDLGSRAHISPGHPSPWGGQGGERVVNYVMSLPVPAERRAPFSLCCLRRF